MVLNENMDRLYMINNVVSELEKIKFEDSFCFFGLKFSLPESFLENS